MRKYLIVALLCLSGSAFADTFNKQDLEKTIFFSVLEGLYQSGLSDSTVDRLLELHPETGRPIYFVYGCPICTPVYNALSAYRTRPVFFRDKSRRRDFSSRGVSALETQLSTSDKAATAQALQKMVYRVLESELQKRRLSKAERGDWDALMAAASDEGGKLLKNYPEQESWMESCPSCSGASNSSQPVSQGAFSTPSDAWETLNRSRRTENAELFISCWDPEEKDFPEMSQVLSRPGKFKEFCERWPFPEGAKPVNVLTKGSAATLILEYFEGGEKKEDQLRMTQKDGRWYLIGL